MPNPIKHEHVTSWSLSPTWVRDHRPECVTAIGLVALGWNRLEKELGSMISGILGQTSKGDDGGFGINPNWILSTVMVEAETIRARIKIVSAVLSRILNGNALESEWDNLSARLYKRARDRNIVVHTEWAWSEQAPDVLLRIDKGNNVEGWSEGDFLDAFERIHALEIELHLFMKDVLNGIHAGDITSNITPDMILD